MKYDIHEDKNVIIITWSENNKIHEVVVQKDKLSIDYRLFNQMTGVSLEMYEGFLYKVY